MDVIKHSTPDSRRDLKDYLRNRRLSGSLHLTTARMALADLDTAIALLKGLRHPSAGWAEAVEGFLGEVAPEPAPDPSQALPGLLSGMRGGAQRKR